MCLKPVCCPKLINHLFIYILTTHSLLHEISEFFTWCVLKSGHVPKKQNTVAQTAHAKYSTKMTVHAEGLILCTLFSNKSTTQNRRHVHVFNRVFFPCILWKISTILRNVASWCSSNSPSTWCVMTSFVAVWNIQYISLFTRFYPYVVTFSNTSAIATSAIIVIFLRFIDRYQYNKLLCSLNNKKVT